MKSEDFERLKAVCEKEGFELLNESAKHNDKFFVVKKAKDERIKVTVFSHIDYTLMHRIDFRTNRRVDITKKELDFLASALEAFLNNE